MAPNQCGACPTYSATAFLVPLLERCRDFLADRCDLLRSSGLPHGARRGRRPRSGKSMSAAHRCVAGQPQQRGNRRAAYHRLETRGRLRSTAHNDRRLDGVHRPDGRRRRPPDDPARRSGRGRTTSPDAAGPGVAGATSRRIRAELPRRVPQLSGTPHLVDPPGVRWLLSAFGGPVDLADE